MEKERVKAELEGIAKKNGALNPHDVVKFAENPKTALHACFTWDDGEAAIKWRVHEARMLIRVIVNVIPVDGEDREYRAFVSLKDDRHLGTGYRTMVSILDDEELRDQLLKDALEEMEAFQAKYKDIQELCDVFVAIEKVKEKVRRKRYPVVDRRPELRA